MRDLHARMLAALLDGEGLRGIAELAAEEAGGPVAIVLPDPRPRRRLLARRCRSTSFRGTRLCGSAAAAPEKPARRGGARAQVSAGDEAIGYVLALRGVEQRAPSIAVDREEVLRTTALAALAEVAVTEARDEVADEVRGSLIEDLRAGRVDARETARRAARLGCDLSAARSPWSPRCTRRARAMRPALIAGEHEGAIAEPLGERIYAILPARGGDHAPERPRPRRAALAAPAPLARPGCVLVVLHQPGRAHAGGRRGGADARGDRRRTSAWPSSSQQGIGDGVYRLLFRALATDPDEVRRFYGDTVEPLVDHDRQYRTDLLGTVEAYLANDCNMNATARAVYAHRHTVAHRLARVKELTGLDPGLGEDRERLGLGIKAYRMLAPTLPR